MIPLPNADVIFNLLAQMVAGPNPDAMPYLADALAEAGRDDLRWILEGLCPLCGGEMKKTKRLHSAGDRNAKYWRCKRCRETDVDYADIETAYLFNQRWRRVCRLLKVRECPGGNHSYFPRPDIIAMAIWVNNPKCPRCDGRGIIP